MRPDCYGQYSAHPRSPCRGCALQGPCAHLVSDVEGFSILARPRHAKAVEVYTVTTALFYPEVANPIHRGLAAIGLSRSGGTHDCWYTVKWKPRTVRFGRLMEARPGRVVFYFEVLPISEAEILPAISRLPYGALFRHPGKPGSVVVVDTADALLVVAASVATPPVKP